MNLKNRSVEFLAFNSGILKIYNTDDEGEIINGSYKQYRYGDRTIGVKRYFSARQNDIELDKVVHIHQNISLRTDDAVVINGTRFKIEQIQHLYDTNPKCTVLSLRQRGIYEGAENELF